MPDGNSFAAAAPAADPVDVAVGARIRLRRKQLQISQSALGDALGVSFQQVQKYERGTNRVSCSMLSRIAAKLDATAAFFFAESPDAVPVDPALSGLLVSHTGSELVRLAAHLPAMRLRSLVNVARALQAEG